MTIDGELLETYFCWLKEECFTNPTEKDAYEGVLRVLNDIPFYWTFWSDENRAGDALTYRQYEFLHAQRDLGHIDQHWLHQWATATPSVLEVLVAICHRWTMYFGGSSPFFFGHLFRNLGLTRFPGKNLPTSLQNEIRSIADVWMSRQFQSNGHGSPFPVHHALDVIDMRTIDIWGQMNAYSAEHFQ